MGDTRPIDIGDKSSSGSINKSVVRSIAIVTHVNRATVTHVSRTACYPSSRISPDPGVHHRPIRAFTIARNAHPRS